MHNGKIKTGNGNAKRWRRDGRRARCGCEDDVRNEKKTQRQNERERLSCVSVLLVGPHKEAALVKRDLRKPDFQ